MDKTISFVMKKVNMERAIGQYQHDMRLKIPSYVKDVDIDGNQEVKLGEIFAGMKKEHKDKYNRKWQSKAMPFYIGLLSLNDDKLKYNIISDDDRKYYFNKAKAFIEKKCAELESELIYFVGHNDESEEGHYHFHFMMKNQNTRTKLTIAGYKDKKKQEKKAQLQKCIDPIWFKSTQEELIHYFADDGFIKKPRDHNMPRKQIQLSVRELHELGKYKDALGNKILEKQKELEKVEQLLEQKKKQIQDISKQISAFKSTFVKLAKEGVEHSLMVEIRKNLNQYRKVFDNMCKTNNVKDMQKIFGPLLEKAIAVLPANDDVKDKMQKQAEHIINQMKDVDMSMGLK